MVIQAFSQADHYTMMSLCDVIFHICSCLDIKIIENLLVHVMPYLIKLFNVMRED
jgi:hypothetical protein